MFLVPVPSLEKQQTFVNQMKVLDTQISKMKAAFCEGPIILHLSYPKSFSGEVVMQPESIALPDVPSSWDRFRVCLDASAVTILPLMRETLNDAADEGPVQTFLASQGFLTYSHASSR